MDFIPIKVECRSGYKADEYPRCFYRGTRMFDITAIIDRWYQGDANPEWPAADYFKVRVTGGSEFIIRHERETDRWFLMKPQETPVSFSNN